MEIGKPANAGDFLWPRLNHSESSPVVPPDSSPWGEHHARRDTS